MGECNLSLSYNGTENQEKFCKYSYSSWCSTCERNSPRRRSRSETNETNCRKKCKEMKTLTPKKYNKCTEYENMELEYDYKGWHETKYDCCRLRPNLVELPTTYISNNCQITSNLISIPNSDMKQLDCTLKGVNGKSYEHSLKFVDLNKQLQTLDASQEVHKVITDKITSVKLEPIIKTSSCSCYNNSPKTINEVFTKSKSPMKDNQDLQNANLRGYELYRSNDYCREYCLLSDLKYHQLDHNTVCYDTSTYFNNQTMSTGNLKDIQYLREQLTLLRRSSYEKSNRGSIRPSFVDATIEIDPFVNPTVEVNSSFVKPSLEVNPSFVAPIVEIHPSLNAEEKKIPLKPVSRTKFGVKIKRIGSAKSRKPKLKSNNTVVNSKAESTDSDCEDSDSDVVDDEPLDEEPDSISSNNSSTDESTKDSSDTTGSNGICEIGSGDTFGWPIRPSLFPNIPPYIKFHSHDSEVPYQLPSGSKKFFKWKLSTITPIIVRKTLTNSGFALVRSEFSRESNQWLGTWGKHMRSPMFKTLKDMQKLNHFPGTFHLGRKDRLWRNFQKMISKFGLKEFGFLPHSYILPHELKLLKQNWEFRNTSGKDTWIIKPPASARGVGIKVINKWSQLPKKTSLVVQKYISNPYLINGSKFDLRLYVLVTSFHPLRIYLWPDGLARFASAKYSDDVKDLKDRYMHLTNYSINKLSSQYTANADANACSGHKWTISKLMEYLSNEGIDTNHLWRNLQQLVIKTIISSEALITPLCEENINSLYNCYELFGIDVLLDEHLKPWLLEVNISPSLHSASPLDAHVKGPLVQTLFDMAQFHFPSRLGQYVRQAPQCHDNKMYARSLTKKERCKHMTFTQFESREDYVYDILKDLTGDDVRHLTRAEDEYVAKGMFERIFPTVNTHKYMEFMEVRYYNRLFDAWETKYATRRDDGIALLQTLCAQKLHLKTGVPSAITKNSLSTIPGVVVENRPMQPSLTGQSRPLEVIMQETSLTTNMAIVTNGN